MPTQHSKTQLFLLNRRREIQRRRLFVQKRSREMLTEAAWAQGSTEIWRLSLKRPPEWALAAAKISLERILEPFLQMRNSVDDDPRSVMAEVRGIYDTMVAHVYAPARDSIADKDSGKAVAELRRYSKKFVSRDLAKLLDGLDKKLNSELSLPTHAQLKEYSNRRTKGLNEFLADDGELVALKSMANQIAYAVWFFWPILVTKDRIRSEDLRKFMGDQMGLFASIKTVEIIHSKVGLAKHGSAKSSAT